MPCVLWAFVHMAAMGLWRPPVGPGGPGLDTVHRGRPVGSRYMFSRTAYLRRCGSELELYIVRTGS